MFSVLRIRCHLGRQQLHGRSRNNHCRSAFGVFGFDRRVLAESVRLGADTTFLDPRDTGSAASRSQVFFGIEKDDNRFIPLPELTTRTQIRSLEYCRS